MVSSEETQDRLVGSPCSPRDSQESSPTLQFESIHSLALSLLYGPALTSVYAPAAAAAKSCQSCPTLCDPIDGIQQAPLSSTVSWRLLKFMSIKSVMPSNDLILCLPLLLLPSIFPRIRVFSSELAFPIRWLKYWSFSFSTSPFNEFS